MKKTIIFDVDWVITDSWASKELIIQNILERNGLFNIPGVSDVFGIGLNRVLLLDWIYELQEFDKQKVLDDINTELWVLESRVSLIPETHKFIKTHFERYLFFTNTSLPKRSLNQIFSDLDMWKYFMELLAYDDGSKKENIEYVMQVYDINPEDILFIDDKQSHIDAVKNTWVHPLLFKQDGVSLDEKVSQIFK